jgi:iron complex transport system substrate-binding protein
MTSKEVSAAMEDWNNRFDGGPPGHWRIDTSVLATISPRVVFVQECCEICDPAQSNVMFALDECHLRETCLTVQVSPTTLEEVRQSILNVGAALGVEEKGEELCRSLRARLQVVATKVEQLNTDRP